MRALDRRALRGVEAAAARRAAPAVPALPPGVRRADALAVGADRAAGPAVALEVRPAGVLLERRGEARRRRELVAGHCYDFPIKNAWIVSRPFV